jgi:hypothetical protein
MFKFNKTKWNEDVYFSSQLFELYVFDNQYRPVVLWRNGTRGTWSFFLKGIYCTDSIYSVYKDKLQDRSCNQFE